MSKGLEIHALNPKCFFYYFSGIVHEFESVITSVTPEIIIYNSTYIHHNFNKMVDKKVYQIKFSDNAQVKKIGHCYLTTSIIFGREVDKNIIVKNYMNKKTFNVEYLPKQFLTQEIILDNLKKHSFKSLSSFDPSLLSQEIVDNFILHHETFPMVDKKWLNNDFIKTYLLTKGHQHQRYKSVPIEMINRELFFECLKLVNHWDVKHYLEHFHRNQCDYIDQEIAEYLQTNRPQPCLIMYINDTLINEKFITFILSKTDKSEFDHFIKYRQKLLIKFSDIIVSKINFFTLFNDQALIDEKMIQKYIENHIKDKRFLKNFPSRLVTDEILKKVIENIGYQELLNLNILPQFYTKEILDEWIKIGSSDQLFGVLKQTPKNLITKELIFKSLKEGMNTDKFVLPELDFIDEEFCIDVIKKTYSISLIPDKFVNQKIVDKTSDFLHMTKIPENLINQRIVDNYILYISTSKSLRFIPQRFITQEIVDKFTKHNSSDIIRAPEIFITKDKVLDYVKSYNNLDSTFLKNWLNDDEILSEYLKKNNTSYDIQIIPREKWTKEIVDKYLRSRMRNMTHIDHSMIPNEFISETFLVDFVKYHKKIWKTIPLSLKSNTVILQIINENKYKNWLKIIPAKWLDQEIVNNYVKEKRFKKSDIPKKFLTDEINAMIK